MKFKEFVSLLENTSFDVEKPLTSKDILSRLKELTKGPPDPHYGGLPNMPGKYVERTSQDDEAAKLAKQYLDALDREKKQKFGESVEHLDEVLSKSAPIEDWIHDFVHSDNPKFKGKTKEERRKMAIAAYYGAHGKSKESQNESIELQIENILNELDVSTIQSYKEKAEDVIKQTKPFTRKGEYRDIAKNIVARKEKGVEMAKQRLQQSDLKQS